MMIEVFVATQNKGKQNEIKEILKKISEEIGEGIITIFPSEREKVPENGRTYFENAFSKAMWWIENKGVDIPVISEDSGLEIFALDKYPGVMSSLIPHKDATDKDRCIYILNKMRSIEKRDSRYVSCVIITLPNRVWFYDIGYTYGIITDEIKGEGGFGYDPIFFSHELNKTFGEATIDEKNSVSHRSRAFEKLKPVLKKLKEL